MDEIRARISTISDPRHASYIKHQLSDILLIIMCGVLSGLDTLGDLALYAGLAGGAETVIVPEVDFKVEDVCNKLKTTQKRGKRHSIIVLAEGVGNAQDLGKEVIKETGADLRVTVLGHVQRGGSPTAFDRILASRMGVRAVELLLDGKAARVVGIRDNKIIDMDIHEALSMTKEFDKDTYEMVKILSI